MKITAYLGALVLLLSLSIQSCKKHTEESKTNYQTIDVVLDANKSYQYNFGEANTNLSITKQAQACQLSEIDKSGNASVLNYIPRNGFTGTDVVEVTLANGKCHQPQESNYTSTGSCQQQMHGGNNNCSHHHDCHKNHCDHHTNDKTVYTFNITIHQTAVTAATRVATLNAGN